jgi:hypothetical protein
MCIMEMNGYLHALFVFSQLRLDLGTGLDVIEKTKFCLYRDSKTCRPVHSQSLLTVLCEGCERGRCREIFCRRSAKA